MVAQRPTQPAATGHVINDTRWYVSPTRFALWDTGFQEKHPRMEVTDRTDFEVKDDRTQHSARGHLQWRQLTAMAKRRTYKRDGRGRFASTGSTRVKRIGRKINRRRPRYVRGSLGKTVRVGRVGPGGEYAGVHVGAKLRTRRRGEYYVGVSAGRRIATAFSAY